MFRRKHVDWDSWENEPVQHKPSTTTDQARANELSQPQQPSVTLAAPVDTSHSAPESYSQVLETRQHASTAWRLLGWGTGLAGVFVVSFVATVAPLYLKKTQEQRSNSSQSQTVAAESTASESSSTGVTLGVSTADASNLFGSTGSATSTGLPPGYRQAEDTYKNIKLTITQQDLPSSFNGKPDGVLQVAQNLGATKNIATNRWGTAYMIQSDGAQAVVFANTKRMVVIQAMGILTPAEWQNYINDFE